MAFKGFKRYYVLLLFLLAGSTSFGQNVPFGIFYQAVARDNYGKELVNKDIDVNFQLSRGILLVLLFTRSFIRKLYTSEFGVFSLDYRSGNTNRRNFTVNFRRFNGVQAYHYLKIEVKFDNDFIDMGTMQFLAVPYAFMLRNLLNPDRPDQKVIRVRKVIRAIRLSITRLFLLMAIIFQFPDGNTVNLSTLNVPHQLTLLGDTLSILGGNKVGLTNQIQDLQLM